METSAADRPRLRPVEAFPDARAGRVILRDPTQLAAGALVVGRTEFFLLTLLDGERDRLQIQGEYARETGRLLLSSELDGFLQQLNGAGFLDGDGFDAYYAGLVTEYRSAPYRALRDADGFGVPAKELPDYLDQALTSARSSRSRKGVAGIVAPHLDFPRGLACYSAAYASLDPGSGSLRAVVLGTNHFGRSRSAVATDRDFETPWGVVPADRDFLEALEADLGGNLRPFELDHLREHSIELQAVWLHHLFGDRISIVPVLCPDPSGPRGTAAGDPQGVDLREFALALGERIRRDPTPTLVIASADLSHVGRYFGDELDLDEKLLAVVDEMDQAGLSFIDGNDAEGYGAHMSRTENPPRVCSVGCLYAMMTALGPEARSERLEYRQAVTQEMENCVTSCAYVFRS
jgi:AmmeMemoRadiSam system protein B